MAGARRLRGDGDATTARHDTSRAPDAPRRDLFGNCIVPPTPGIWIRLVEPFPEKKICCHVFSSVELLLATDQFNNRSSRNSDAGITN